MKTYCNTRAIFILIICFHIRHIDNDLFWVYLHISSAYLYIAKAVPSYDTENKIHLNKSAIKIQNTGENLSVTISFNHLSALYQTRHLFISPVCI